MACAPSNGHDVDPVDGFRLALHARLYAAYQRFDLSAAEVIVNVEAGDNPRLARTDECDKDFVNGCHFGVGEEEGSYSFFISRPEWLGGAVNVAIPVSRGGQRPGADEEVVAAFDEPETGADKPAR